MAIDSEAKRRGKVPPLWVLPNPDGTTDQADRQHKGHKYPGILATEPTATNIFNDVLDVTDAIRSLLRGQVTLTDAVRIRAVRELRHIVEDRIFLGRKPQNVRGPCVLMNFSEVQRHYWMEGECPEATSLIEINVFAHHRRKMFLAWDAIRRITTSWTGNVQTIDGLMHIGGMTFETEGEPPPEEPFDGSDRYTFWYQGFLRATHDIKVPGAINYTDDVCGIGCMIIEDPDPAVVFQVS